MTDGGVAQPALFGQLLLAQVGLSPEKPRQVYMLDGSLPIPLLSMFVYMVSDILLRMNVVFWYYLAVFSQI